MDNNNVINKVELEAFKYFKVGTVFNPVSLDYEPKLRINGITIQYPIRLNAMAIDPSRIAADFGMIYTPGEVVFSTQISFGVSVMLQESNDILIVGECSNKQSVIKHVCKIMSQAFKYKGGFKVIIEKYHNYRHCGLGSTGGLQAAIAACINEIFSNPFKRENLIKYLARNYGEEIDNNDELLNPVQCIGGSAASGFYDGGVLVLAGKNTVVGTGIISEDYSVLIGMPKDYVPSDSVSQFDEEKNCLDLFDKCGNTYGGKIAYNVLHYFLPAMVNQDISVMGDVIFDYRYNMGSISNCAYTYSAMVEMMNRLAFLKEKQIVDVLSITSVGPAVFVIVKNEKLDYCKEVFEKEKLDTLTTKINNKSYLIIKEFKYDK